MTILETLRTTTEHIKNWAEGKFLTKDKATTSSSVTLRANAWVGSASPYSQIVGVDGANTNSQIDFQLTPEQFNEFSNARIALQAINDNGVVTVYAIGNKPTSDYTIDVTIVGVVI